MSALYFYLFISLINPYISFYWKIFPRLGRKSWEGLIPGYNYCILFKATNQPWWWGLLFIFPGVHLIMMFIANLGLVRKFGLFDLKSTLMGMFFPYPILYKIAFKEEEKIAEPTDWSNAEQLEKRKNGDHAVLAVSLPIVGHALAMVFNLLRSKKSKKIKKTIIKEAYDAVVFAMIAASIIRTYVTEPYQIPTGSMEKTMLVGDFLFVNKLTYGTRVAMTPLSFPIFHNTIPYMNVDSYLTWETVGYVRMPGYSDVERNDVVVFNFPSGDTAIFDPRVPDGLMGHDFHGYLRGHAFAEYAKLTTNPSFEDYQTNQRAYFEDKVRKDLEKEFGLKYRPVDKRENYIKRCVAIPGDKFEIRHKEFYIDDELAFIPEQRQWEYTISNIGLETTKNMQFKWTSNDAKYLYSTFKDNPANWRNEPKMSDSEYGFDIVTKAPLTSEFYNLAVSLWGEANIKPSEDTLGTYTSLEGWFAMRDFYSEKFRSDISIPFLPSFPNDIQYNWTKDNMGPFIVPEKGATVEINKKTIPLYRRIITAYEGHKLEEKPDGIYIDGALVDTYTFAMNYYFMSGDNRDNSTDSRFWGFVPEDHIVGKAKIIWFSKDPVASMFGESSIRWDRVFTFIE